MGLRSVHGVPYTGVVSLVAKPRPPLADQKFQVIVIGGGINGVAIARQCACAGWRTLLLEQHDFGAGTTSRSTRIIHGGLRYLEHGEIGLVRESLRERRRLLRQYPNLVHPLQFLLALNDDSPRSALKIRTGLWLYRMMGAHKKQSDLQELKKLEQLLDKGRRWSLFSFADAQCEFPERLVADWLVEAMDSWAVARNHAQVLAVDLRQGRATGVLIRDRLTGKEERVEGSWIINATGPWADRICQRSQIKLKNPLIGGVRGSHLVLPQFPGAPRAAVYSEALDGRPFFVIPWNGQMLVGTTEVADNADPAKAQASPDEIAYLLRSFTALFPHTNFSDKDIVYTFAGIRPLPYAPEENPSGLPRKHYLHDHQQNGAARMISVSGGKLTTAVALARECAAKINMSGESSPSTSSKASMMVTSGDINPLLDDFVIEIAQAGGISEGSAAAIVEWHGKRSSAIANMALSSADLRAPLCAHSEHVVAEAVNAFANEGAVTLGDVLLRRVPVALSACWSSGRECSREAARRIGTALKWSASQTASMLEDFEMEREAFLMRPQ